MGPFAIALIVIGGVAAMTLAAHAVRAASRIWLRHWVEQRLRGAGLAEAYLEQPQRLPYRAGGFQKLHRRECRGQAIELRRRIND